MSRWQKLSNFARDPATTPSEKASALRILQALRERGDGPVQVAATESWQLALLSTLAPRFRVEVQPSLTSGVSLECGDVDGLLLEYARLHDVLENVVIAATAGFLSAFAATGKGGGEVSAVARAAASSAASAVPNPLRITSRS